ncbi:uncharacterized protein H6S33_002261 [Morchella sextelata]|uniref:uncharacterized protein n=1 Tax=Morchella sextelata TaxID=1174677 RepID=UPI001D044443|nr:uncharacterized protein H6S33_002261 [Morchella sextelata]KAH0608209.1 hypothetical protein H6S33_002261 [Morchella sextelata]
MAKRKAEGTAAPSSPVKKGKPSKASSPAPAPAPVDVKSSFRKGLFDKAVEAQYREEYASSTPYKHAVIHELIDDALLRSVRTEALTSLHFTPKETDIYRIHQSGDLANLDGLPRAMQKLLPSLRQLRDALYSKTFRDYVCAVTGCGALSGTKTDMAINVYTPGSHLLTHDDVIGSRRVSYILYLTSPDSPWQESWGGALRLYPTVVADDGVTRVPEPMWEKVIPPAWNQLSFFEVQPGLSFHDVEEVYECGDDEERIRMAISGWFHIPQEGEEGYIPGLEEELAEKSSLQQLQSKSDTFDFPKPQAVTEEVEPQAEDNNNSNEEDEEASDDSILTEADLTFLLQYIAPTYLTPDTLEELRDAFREDSSVQITHFLSKSFSAKLKAHLEPLDSTLHAAPTEPWRVATPPHKHRYLYLQQPPSRSDPPPTNPVDELLTVLFPSRPFRKLLQLATDTQLTLAGNLLARRFRRGLDYTLATGYGGSGGAGEIDENGEGDGEAAAAAMRVEVCLGITPSRGWGGEEDDNDDEEAKKTAKGAKGKAKMKVPRPSKFDDSERSVGGYEMYMAGDDSDSDTDDDGDDDDDENEGAKKKKAKKSDPAIYKTAKADDDDSVLFTMPAAWNRFSIVLRDAGVLKFVKYVSQSAKGDRWDVVGEWGVAEDGEEVEGGEDEGEEGEGGEGEGGEDEWAGIEEEE